MIFASEAHKIAKEYKENRLYTLQNNLIKYLLKFDKKIKKEAKKGKFHLKIFLPSIFFEIPFEITKKLIEGYYNLDGYEIKIRRTDNYFLVLWENPTR